MIARRAAPSIPEWRIFWPIVVPLSKADIAVIAPFQAVGYWNTFFIKGVLTGAIKG